MYARFFHRRALKGRILQRCRLPWTHIGQRVAGPDVGFPDAPGGQQGIEVVVIAGHQVICGALEHLGVYNVDAVGVQRQRIMRQGPASIKREITAGSCSGLQHSWRCTE